MIDVLMIFVGNAALGVACYVLGNRRADRIIAYRERQAARVAAFDDSDGDSPVYRKCQCGHNTVSHRVNAQGERGGCVSLTGKDHNYGCACQGYLADPDSLVKKGEGS